MRTGGYSSVMIDQRTAPSAAIPMVCGPVRLLEQVKALEERFEAEVRVPGAQAGWPQCRAGESAAG